MTDALLEIHPAIIGILPISMGIVQLLKGKFSERATPFIALVTSTALAMLAVGEFNAGVVLQGIALGLMSMGLFSGVKTASK